MKKTLYLHIGNHKTGTSSIQRNLMQNRQLLETLGFEYFTYNTQRHCHAYIENNSPNGAFLKNKGELRNNLKRLKPGLDTIISSENFSYFFYSKDIEDIHSALIPFFDDIKVIVYIRRQDAHLVSHYQEGAKPFRQSEYELWGNVVTPLPEFTPVHLRYLDYSSRLGLWEDVFGRDSLIIRVFEPDRLVHSDSFCDFISLLGLDCEQFELSPRSNQSVGFLKSKFGHFLNEKLAGNDALKKYLFDQLSDEGKYTPSLEQMKIYYSHYFDSNKRLNAKYRISAIEDIFEPSIAEGVSSAGFSQGAEEFLEQVFDSLSDLPLQVDDLRDAAIAMEKVNLDASYRLMILAHRLRPEGVFIAEKILQYRSNGVKGTSLKNSDGLEINNTSDDAMNVSETVLLKERSYTSKTLASFLKNKLENIKERICK